MLQIYDLRTEYRTDPMGIDAIRPRFSWKFTGDIKNLMQSAWQIVAYEGETLLWDSGRVESAQSQQLRWDGSPLHSMQSVRWQVTVWVGEEQAVSPWARFEMGLLQHSDWQGKWIEPEDEVDPTVFKPAPYLRRRFTLRQPVVRARIYQTAHGLYQFWLNGQLGTEDRFNPGFTSYHKRLQYQVYDVTKLLHPGENIWAVILGDGWWRGTTGGAVRNNFGDKLGFLGQLYVEYTDGSCEWISSDEQFRTATGGYLCVDMQAIERYDARLEPYGWKLPGYDDSAWNAVHIAGSTDYDNLIATRSVPMRAAERFIGKPIRTPSGETVIDFGQNIAGQLRLTLRGGKPGQKITVHCREILSPDGNFASNTIGKMAFDGELQQLDYIMFGSGEETYSNLFMINGFRYIKIDNYDSVIVEGDFIAEAIYSRLDEVGDFLCSNPLINQLVRNSRWSQKGNFLDVPTDCPTRERSPWTGDAQLYCRTAAEFMNVYPFYEKLCADLVCEQHKSGRIASTVPCTQAVHNWNEYNRFVEKQKAGAPPTGFPPMHVEDGLGIDGASGWGDAATIIPWTVYQCYGDTAILEQNYESAKKWVDWELRNAANPSEEYADQAYYANPDDARWIWDTGFHFGEWSEPRDPNAPPPVAMMRPLPDLWVATAYMGYSAQLVSRMASVLGKSEDAAHYAHAADEIARVYSKYLIHEDGSVVAGKQASNVRVLALNMCSEEQRPVVAARLAQMIINNDYHLNTGFLSTPFLLGTLVEYGYTDIAFRLLEQETAPSWLRNVILGATTITEGWDGLEHMHGSLNHYSYGAVCDFLFSYVAGIRLDRPGWQQFRIEPVIGGTLTHAAASFESPYGLIQSSWKLTEAGTEYRFTIPANTTAQVLLSGMEPMTLGSGSYCYTV